MATVKKATTTRTVRKVTPKSEEMETPVTTSDKPRMSMHIKKKYALTAGAVIIVIGLLYLLRSFFIVAIVNGQPISRFSIIQQLEKQGGKQVLNVTVTKLLIEQEAKKKNISVAQSDIDAEVKKTETSLASQGQTLDQALAFQGMTRADYIEQVRLQLVLQKMIGQIQVSEKDINDYIEQNKASIPEGSNMDQIKKSVAEQLKQQKSNEKIQKLVGELQKNAKTTYFLEY